jgi:hypothetical protein
VTFAEATESEKRRIATSNLSQDVVWDSEIVKKSPVAFPEMGLSLDLLCIGMLLSKVAALQIAPIATTCNRLPDVSGSGTVRNDCGSKSVSKMARLSTCIRFCVNVPVLS